MIECMKSSGVSKKGADKVGNLNMIKMLYMRCERFNK